MDDLEAVWGPGGRATTDPSSIRSIAPVDPVGVPDGPGPIDVEVDVVVPAPVPAPRRAERSKRPAIAVATIGVTAMLTAAAVVLIGGRGSGGDTPAERDVEAAGRWGTATTIVSAAADLLPSSDDEADAAAAATEPDTEPAPSPTTTTAATAATASGRAAASTVDLAAVERAAGAFVDVLMRRDCDGMWSMLDSRSHQFLSATNEPGEPSGRDMLCEGLKSEAHIPAITVRGPARAIGTGRAVVELEAEGEDEREPLYLVLEDGQWLVDLLGPLDDGEGGGDDPGGSGGSADEVQVALRNGLAAESVVFTDTERFSDDVAVLADIEPAIEWRVGIAPTSAQAGDVFVAVADDARVVCLSARADNGARFMVKRTADGTTTYAGGEIPSACDAAPLSPSW